MVVGDHRLDGAAMAVMAVMKGNDQLWAFWVPSQGNWKKKKSAKCEQFENAPISFQCCPPTTKNLTTEAALHQQVYSIVLARRYDHPAAVPI